MNLAIVRGDTVVSPMSPAARTFGTEDITIELTANGSIKVCGRGGTPFFHMDATTRQCTIDVLNIPHIDVGKRKADLLAKANKIQK